MEDATTHCPFQTSKTLLQLKICGLEHCRVRKGHAAERFSDVFFSFLFAMFSEPQAHSVFAGLGGSVGSGNLRHEPSASFIIS